ncbi:hypothetical protein AYO44_12665 [Planctomycetaceae bacterium SCGC AG-212-F19]|nr:hypothetical protein AYO44_12665 [Planctomycetaceae bacterium SCGC AG-212-F19]
MLGVALLLSGGCGQVKWQAEEKYASVPPKEEVYLPMPAPPRAVEVRVEAKSSGVPIELYLVKANNPEEAERIVRKQDTNQFICSAIGKVDPVREGKLAVDNGYVIVLINTSRDKSAPVTVRITEK